MKTLLALAALTIAFSITARAAAEYETDLNKAVAAASEQKKMMFVIYGREACGNCQATKQMIKSKQIKVSDSKFVLVDLNCDDKAVSAEFRKRFSAETFGNTLPFVVVADSSGNALASSGGYKSPDDWEKILKTAQRKAGGTAAGGATGAAKSDWPFNTKPAGASTPAPR
jgi:thioredoxin-related protein